jgi:hypothetical protein
LADTFLDCQDILAGSGAAMWQDYLGYMRQILRMNLQHLQELVHCRSPESLITRHAELTVKGTMAKCGRSGVVCGATGG